MSGAASPGAHPPSPAGPGPGGLCPDCRHVRVVRSPAGSTFLLCELSREDPTYRRYPPQPRLACAGFER